MPGRYYQVEGATTGRYIVEDGSGYYLLEGATYEPGATGMLRYVDLKNRVKRLMDEASTSDVTDTTESLVEDAINASHQRLCLIRAWGFMLWPREETFTTTAGTRLVALNQYVGRLLHVWDPTAHTFLPMMPRRQWEAQSVDRTNASDFNGIIYGSYWPVAAQPSTATVLTIVSSSALDTGSSYQVLVRGLDSDGEVQVETIDATGTVTASGAVEFLHVLGVTKIGTWVGTMTLKVGATTMLALGPSQYGKQYPTIEFVEKPSAARTFSYTFTRNPNVLTEDNDIPEIPYPHSEILVYDALLDLVTYRTDVNAAHVALWTIRRESILKQLHES